MTNHFSNEDREALEKLLKKFSESQNTIENENADSEIEASEAVAVDSSKKVEDEAIVIKSSDSIDELAIKSEDLDDDDEKTLKSIIKPKRKGLIAIVLIVGIILSISAAYGWISFVEPSLKQVQAERSLSGELRVKGDITGINGEMIPIDSAGIEGTNVEQSALGMAGVATSPASFIFTNGQPSADRKIVDVYIDFYNQRGRDFILINQDTLKSLVESGSIELRIHPVPTGSAFSLYAPEALAEVFATAPDRGWPVFIGLLKESITLNTDQASDIVKIVADVARENGANEVDEASITNGTFASWIVSVSDDPRLSVGYYPPVVYVNDKELDQSIYDLNSPDSLLRAFL